MNSNTGRAGVIRARDDAGSMDKLVCCLTLRLFLALVFGLPLSLGDEQIGP